MGNIYKTTEDHVKDMQQEAGTPPIGAPGSVVGASTFGGSPASVGYSAEAPSASPAATATTGGQSPQAPAGGVTRAGSQFFSPIERGLATGQSAIKTAVEDFRSRAGEAPTFGAEQEGQLQAFGETGAGRQATVDLLSSAYGGPRDLESGQVVNAYAAAGDLKERGQDLFTARGVADLVRGANPGLTPGQARFESRSVLESPSYREQARNYQVDIGRLYAQINNEQQRARDFAVERDRQSKAVADASKGYLARQRTQIDDALADQVEIAKEGQAATKAQWDTFNESGDIRDLEGLDVADLERFDTAAAQQAVRARESWDAINTKYDAIKDIPLMTLKTTSHGREKLAFDSTWWREHKTEYTKPQQKEIRQLVKERQLELEAAGFSRQTGRRRSPSQRKAIRERAKEGKADGEFSDVRPLYFGSDLGPEGAIKPYDPTEVVSFFKFDPGLSPSRHNVSTTVQREQFNRISEVLGEVERLIEGGNPQRAATIAADIDAYLMQEELDLERRGEILDERQKSWKKRVGRARKAYRKATSTKSKVIAGAHFLAPAPGLWPLIGAHGWTQQQRAVSAAKKPKYLGGVEANKGEL